MMKLFSWISEGAHPNSNELSFACIKQNLRGNLFLLPGTK